MARASQAQRAQRLNLARSLLHRLKDAEALRELARRCSISPRQAYRYLQQARRLQQPLPVTPPTIAFTVKLDPALVSRLRRYAQSGQRSLSEVVSQSLLRMLAPRRRRG
jgi:predicted DNA-binding transcriptional regulator YafY